MNLAVIRPTFETIGRQDDITSKMLDMHVFRLAAVRDDMRAIVIVNHQLRPLIALIHKSFRCFPQPSARIRITDACHGGLRIAGGQLLNKKIASHRRPCTAFADQKAWMTKSNRRRQEAVDTCLKFLWRTAERLAFFIKHRGAADTEIAFLIMDFVQIKINEPWTVRQAIRTVLCVISVCQPTVETEMRPFGIDGPIPRLFLHQHDFAISVEDLRERTRAGHAIVVITTAPWCYRCMNIAVRCAEMELLLNDWRQFFSIFNGPQRLWRIATTPCVHQLVVGIARHHVRAPIFVHRSKIREIVVRTIDETKRVLHVSCIVTLPFVTTFSGRGTRAEREALFAITPARLMVGDDAMAHAVTPDIIPILLVRFTVTRAMGAPHSRSRHMLPWRFRIRNIWQRLFKFGRNRDEETFIDIVPLSVRLWNIFNQSVELHNLAWIPRATRAAAVGQIPVRMTA